MTDRQLADTIVKSLGYRLFAGSVDKSKVQSAAKGQRRPAPSNREARVAWELYLREPAPTPKPLSDLAPIWQADAVFTEGALSNFNGVVRAKALATGWTVAYVQLLHTAYATANEAEIPVFTAEGWRVAGWGTYGQGSDPYADGLAAAAICRRLPVLQGWKANGEAWAESDGAWKTGRFVEGWVAGGAPCALGFSCLSSDTANFARSFDYVSALRIKGADVDVQVYGADHPGLTVGAALGMLAKANVPTARTAMTFSLNGDGNGPFADYLQWAGPRRLWRPDRATLHTFTELAR